MLRAAAILSRSQAARRALLWLAPLSFLALFYFYPLGSILAASFARLGDGRGALLADLLSPRIARVAGFTFAQAGLSTLLTLAAGMPAAYLLARFDFRGKSFFQALSGIPFVLPVIVAVAAFDALLGPQGWVNAAVSWLGLSLPPLRFTGTLTAILAAHVFYNTTIVIRTVGGFWAQLDPRLAQAAQTLGASRLNALRRVTLPLLAPAIAAAALLVFLFDFTSFGVILILGGPRFATLEVEIYNQTVNLFNLPLAAALSLLQLAFTLLFTAAYSRLAARLARPLTLRPPRFTQRPLSTWPRRLAAAGVLLPISVLLTLPLLALMARSFVAFERQAGQVSAALTLENYRQLSVNRRDALFFAPPAASAAVSLGYAAVTVLLSLSLGMPAAWALSRDRRSTLNRLLDPLILLPLGTSSVTLGLGFILALDQPPLDLRASPWLPPLAHTLAAFPFVVRSLTPALNSLDPRLRQAAAALGANPWQALRAVEAPLIGRALLTAGVFAFTLSLGEFGATALVARPEYPTLPIAIYRYLGRPGAASYGQALALSAILMAAAAAGMLLIERFRIGENQEF